MLQNLKALYGHKLSALDDGIGWVKDFYFDDKTWTIRYVVADTGPWLPDRLLLLSPHAFAKLDLFENTLHLKLTKAQIENSPVLERHQIVSRPYEADYHGYYGWPAYWEGGAIWGDSEYPATQPFPLREGRKPRPHPQLPDEKSLRSTKAVANDFVQGADGVSGFVRDFMVDDRSWAIRHLVVETDQRHPEKEILISPHMISRFSHEDSGLFANLPKAEIQRSMDNNEARAGAR